MTKQSWTHTDLEVFPVALGAMRIVGWQEKGDLTPYVDRAEKLMETALDCGVNLIDHADLYGSGKCETVFGRVLERHPEWRERIILQTKCGIQTNPQHRYNQTRDHLLGCIDGSLQRLSVEQLDVFLIHRPDPLMDPEVVADAFATAQKAGKVRHFGVSNFSRFQMERLQAACDQPLVANQIQLSAIHPWPFSEGVFVNRTEFQATGAEGLVDYCAQHRVQVQAWSPLAGGALVEGDDSDERAAAVRKAIRAVAEETGLSPEGVGVAWLRAHPAPIMPIVGTMNPDRLRLCCAAVKNPLTQTQWWDIFNASLGRRLP